MPGEPAAVVPRPAAHFLDETVLRGLWFRHEGKDEIEPQGRPRRYVYGSGLAAADVNGDGWDDLVLASGDRISILRSAATSRSSVRSPDGQRISRPSTR